MCNHGLIAGVNGCLKARTAGYGPLPEELLGDDFLELGEDARHARAGPMCALTEETADKTLKNHYWDKTKDFFLFVPKEHVEGVALGTHHTILWLLWRTAMKEKLDD